MIDSSFGFIHERPVHPVGTYPRGSTDKVSKYSIFGAIATKCDIYRDVLRGDFICFEFS
jgi:hypothetical protein